MKHRRWFIGLVVMSFSASASAALLEIDNSTFEQHVETLRQQVFLANSGLYDPPTAQDQSDFASLADDLWSASSDAQLQALVAPAASLGYDVVKLTDAGAVYYGLQERTDDAATLGWGSYFLRQGVHRVALIEAPHPRFDTNTPAIAAAAFVDSEARAFLMAGAHRNANGEDTADVAHLDESIFLEVHKAWNGPAGEYIAWQVHGFNYDNYDPPYYSPFPVGTDAVLSNGTGGVSAQVLALDAAIEALGAEWDSYAYNNLNVNDPLNQAVNGNVAGVTFGPPGGLGATTNKQQLYSTSIGGLFVHMEFEQSFRLDNGGAGIPLAASALTDAILASSVLSVPEPATIATLCIGVAMAARRHRSRRRSGATPSPIGLPSIPDRPRRTARSPR